MKKLFCLAVFFLMSPVLIKAQGLPNTEIYVFDFKIWLDQFSLSNPQNVTSHPGFYDNQPYFTPEGVSFLYSSSDETGKTDVFLYDLMSNSKRRITYTPEVNEFSPTIMPDKKQFSCVILEENGNQRLWKYFLDAPIASLVSEIDHVGYHAWINIDELAVFIVGEGNNHTLHVLHEDGSGDKKVASKIGPSISKVPDQQQVSFIDMSTRKGIIKSYDIRTGETKTIVDAVPDSQYFTWTPTGIILMGNGQKLFKFDPKTDKNWVELADLSAYGLNKFSRIAVNDQVTKLAVVVEE